MIGRALAVVLFAPAPAFAADCSSFNAFPPSLEELRGCIKDMKFLYDIRLQTLESENQLLRSQVCTLALEIDKINPSADVVRVSCDFSKPTKRQPPKPATKPIPLPPTR